MRWCTWSSDKQRNLEDVNWILPRMEHLAKLHQQGRTALAEESYFKSGDPDDFDRIIMMAARIYDGIEPMSKVVGMKWISSRVKNRQLNLPRGEAVTILNDGHTGLPLVGFESGKISLARTAAFNVAVLRHLIYEEDFSIGLFGCGRVHIWQLHYMLQLWPNLQIDVYDPDPEQVARFKARFPQIVVSSSPWVPLTDDVVSLATSGVAAWVPCEKVRSDQIWLNTSLRDIVPRMFEQFPLVVVDDVGMAATCGTPFHRALEAGWVRRIQTLADIRDCDLDSYFKADYCGEHPIIVNPMGLALWDVGIGFELFKEEFREEFYALGERGVSGGLPTRSQVGSDRPANK